MEAKKVFKFVVFILRAILIAAFILSIFYTSWFNAAIAALAFILTFLPSWLEKKYAIDIPLDFEIVIILFIFASLFLGEITRFYKFFWWWDILLHTISSISFATIGFIIIFIFFKTNKIISQPFWIAVFSFCFSVTVGVIWEIFEFFMDQTFGFNMQKSGLIDTMSDLISDCFGAIIASAAGYAYLKGGQPSYLGRLINSFVISNGLNFPSQPGSDKKYRQ